MENNNISNINNFTEWIYSKKDLIEVNKQELLADFYKTFGFNSNSDGNFIYYDILHNIIKSSEEKIKIKYLHLFFFAMFTIHTNQILIDSIYDE